MSLRSLRLLALIPGLNKQSGSGLNSLKGNTIRQEGYKIKNGGHGDQNPRFSSKVSVTSKTPLLQAYIKVERICIFK